jgi:hypothetical protein
MNSCFGQVVVTWQGREGPQWFQEQRPCPRKALAPLRLVFAN